MVLCSENNSSPIVKGTVSLISFSVCLSFEYGERTDMFEPILYPATLFKLFISCRSSLVEFLRSPKYTVISSANSDNLTASFPTCIHLTSFCCLITLVRASSTILNKYIQRGQHCLFPDFSRIGSNFSLVDVDSWIAVCCFYYVQVWALNSCSFQDF